MGARMGGPPGGHIMIPTLKVEILFEFFFFLVILFGKKPRWRHIILY